MIEEMNKKQIYEALRDMYFKIVHMQANIQSAIRMTLSMEERMVFLGRVSYISERQVEDFKSMIKRLYPRSFASTDGIQYMKPYEEISDENK